MQLCSTSTTRKDASPFQSTNDSEMLRWVMKILKYTVNTILVWICMNVQYSKDQWSQVLNSMFTYTCYAMMCPTHSSPHAISPTYPICHVTSLRSWALRFSTVHSTGTKDLKILKFENHPILVNYKNNVKHTLSITFVVKTTSDTVAYIVNHYI